MNQKQIDSFSLTIAGLAVICMVAFGSSAFSLYDYARSQGHSVLVSIAFPAVADLIVLVSHGGAVWLIRHGFSSGRATAMIWAGGSLSVLGNFVHAPTDGGDSFLFPVLGVSIYASQLIGSLPPIGLLATSSFVMFLFERKMEIGQGDITTDKATGKQLLAAPALRQNGTTKKKMSATQKRRQLVDKIESDFPDMTQPEKAKKAGCTVRTYQRDLHFNSIQG